MKTILTIAFISVTLLSFGQTDKTIEIAKDKNGNKVSWYDNVNKDRVMLDLDDLKDTEDKLNIRIWFYNVLVDVRQRPNGTAYAEVIPYVFRTVGGGKTPESQRIKVNGDLTKQILQTVRPLVELPDAHTIEDYNWDFHNGVNILVEVATPSSYRFYTYYSPWLQKDAITEAKSLADIADYLYENLELMKQVNAFISTLPPGKYVDYHPRGRVFIKQ